MVHEKQNVLPLSHVLLVLYTHFVQGFYVASPMAPTFEACFILECYTAVFPEISHLFIHQRVIVLRFPSNSFQPFLPVALHGRPAVDSKLTFRRDAFLCDGIQQCLAVHKGLVSKTKASNLFKSFPNRAELVDQMSNSIFSYTTTDCNAPWPRLDTQWIIFAWFRQCHIRRTNLVLLIQFCCTC